MAKFWWYYFEWKARLGESFLIITIHINKQKHRVLCRGSKTWFSRLKDGISMLWERIIKKHQKEKAILITEVCEVCKFYSIKQAIRIFKEKTLPSTRRPGPKVTYNEKLKRHPIFFKEKWTTFVQREWRKFCLYGWNTKAMMIWR